MGKKENLTCVIFHANFTYNRAFRQEKVYLMIMADSSAADGLRTCLALLFLVCGSTPSL